MTLAVAHEPATPPAGESAPVDRPTPGDAPAGVTPVPSAAPWTTVAVHRRGARRVADLRRGALAPYALDDDGRVLRVALVATGALLLGGDHVRVRVHVGPGAALELVETSGTVAYDGRGRSARWEVEVVVEDGGVLVWDTQPFVVSTGADVHRTTTVRLGAGSVAFLRETVVLGRSGETGGRLRTRTRVDGPRGPVLVEELRLAGGGPEPGVLGAHRVLDQVVLVGRRPDEAPPDSAAPGGARPAVAADGPGSTVPPTVLVLEEPGAVARRLGAEVHRVDLSAVAARWSRRALAGRG